MQPGERYRKLGLAIALAAGLAACDSPDEKAQDYLASAREFYTAGDIQKADIELRNALKLNPRLAEAHFLRAKIFESRQAIPEMFRELQTTVQIDEKHLEANLMLARLQALGGQFDEAQAAVDRARGIAPGDFRVTRAQAMVHAREQRMEEALAEVREALAVAPDDLDSQVLLAGLLLETRQFDDAQEVIAKGLLSHPDADALRLLDFQQHALQEQVDKAVAAMQSLIALKRNELAYRQGLALYLVRNERTADAEAVLRKAVTDMPERIEAKLALASFLAQNDTAAAADTLRGFIAEGGAGATQLQLALGDIHAREGELDEAAEAYRAVSGSTDKEDALLARNQLARIAVKQGKSDEAAAMIEQILKADPKNADALASRASIRIAARQTDAAIADLRQALDENPRFVRAHVLLANAQLQNGAVELAKSSLVEALKLDGSYEPAAAQLAGLLIREQRFDKALEVLAPLTARADASKQVRMLELQARLAMQDWSGANTLAGQLGEQENRPGYRKYVEALGLQGQGKHEQAIEGFREVLATDAGMIGALAGIARSYREQGKRADAMKAVQDFVAANPANLAARQLLVTEFLRDNEDAQAKEALEAGLAIDPKWMVGYRGLGSVAMRAQKPAEALAAYERALAVRPDALEFQLLSADVLERSGDKAAAETRYRAVLAKAPTSDVAANNLAVLLAGDGKDKARLAEALEMARRFENSEQPFFADTYAWILYQQGNYSKAAQILDRVVKRAPEEPIFRYHLGAALFQVNDMQNAKVHLGKAQMLAETKGKFDGYDDALALLARTQ